MENMTEDKPQEVRDLPALGIQLGTLFAVAACVWAGIATGSWAWAGWAVTALLVAVSLHPNKPGTQNRWGMPDSAFQAIGLGAIPAGVTLGLTANPWWLGIAAVVMLLSVTLSAEFDKPKADDHG